MSEEPIFRRTVRDEGAAWFVGTSSRRAQLVLAFRARSATQWHYFRAPAETEPCSWRWKMTYMISTGTIVITIAANSAPKSIW